MLSQSQAEVLLKTFIPGVSVEAWTEYQDRFLFRVKYSPEEVEDWDPFFSVDKLTGEVRDFSVITDGNLSEIINELEWRPSGGKT